MFDPSMGFGNGAGVLVAALLPVSNVLKDLNNREVALGEDGVMSAVDKDDTMPRDDTSSAVETWTEPSVDKPSETSALAEDSNSAVDASLVLTTLVTIAVIMGVVVSDVVATSVVVSACVGAECVE